MNFKNAKCSSVLLYTIFHKFVDLRDLFIANLAIFCRKRSHTSLTQQSLQVRIMESEGDIMYM
jgi:hypothetical protein